MRERCHRTPTFPSDLSHGFTEAPHQGLPAPKPRPGLNRRARRQVPQGPAPLGAGRAGPGLSSSPSPERPCVCRNEGFLCQSQGHARDTRSLPATAPPDPVRPPGTFRARRPEAVGFVWHISIKLPRISRLNNSTQKESA